MMERTLRREVDIVSPSTVNASDIGHAGRAKWVAIAYTGLDVPCTHFSRSTTTISELFVVVFANISEPQHMCARVNPAR